MNSTEASTTNVSMQDLCVSDFTESSPFKKRHIYLFNKEN